MDSQSTWLKVYLLDKMQIRIAWHINFEKKRNDNDNMMVWRCQLWAILWLCYLWFDIIHKPYQ